MNANVRMQSTYRDGLYACPCMTKPIPYDVLEWLS